MHLGSTSVLYDVVLIAHVLVGVVGYGVNALTGYYLSRLRANRGDQIAKQYFSNKRSLADKTVLLVPLFGTALLILSERWRYLLDGWFIAVLGFWLLSAGLLSALVWPLGRRIGGGLDLVKVGDIQKIEWVIAAVDLGYVASLALMLFKPRL